MIINDISRSELVRYFCGTSDTSNTSDTSYPSYTSDGANSSNASKTSASLTRLSRYFHCPSYFSEPKRKRNYSQP